jgi:transcriptional regulatory protein RtcR
VKEVEDELERLRAHWGAGPRAEMGGVADRLLGAERAARLDRFERVQLEDVLRVCRGARSLSEAGRTLFAASRSSRTTTNDADRLRKYLARYDLSFAHLRTE